jgi:hypothetical protein
MIFQPSIYYYIVVLFSYLLTVAMTFNNYLCDQNSALIDISLLSLLIVDAILIL